MLSSTSKGWTANGSKGSYRVKLVDMQESFLAVPLHFTLEFTGFVVAAGAAVLVLLRPVLIPGRAIGRLTAAAGFVALAIGGLVHGASFVASDTDPLLIGLRTAGWLMVALAVAGAVPAGTAAAAIATGEPVLYAPPGAAILTAVAAVVRARTTPALNRLAVAGAAAAAAEALITVSHDTVIDDGSASRLTYIAHGLRFAAFVAIALWLWTAVRTSIRSRFVAAFAALLIAVVLALSTTLTGVISDNIESEGLARVRTQLSSVVEDINNQRTELSEVATVVASSPSIQTALVANQGLANAAIRLAQDEVLNVDFIGFVNADGAIVEGESPSINGRNPLRLGPTAIRNILDSPVVTEVTTDDGEASAGINILGDDVIAILAAEEVPHPADPGRRAGVVVTGSYLDAFSVDEISARVKPAQATFLVDDVVVASDLSTAIRAPAEIREPDAGVISQEQSVGDGEFFSAFASLESRGGNAILALTSPSEVVSNTRRDVTRALFLATAAVGAIALLLAWLSGRRITHPIQSLTRTARAVGAGDLSARATVSGGDEVGQLGATFNDMTSALVRMTQEEQALRSRIETIIHSMADGLVAVDGDRRILAFNIEAELLTGVRAEDAVGRPVDEVLNVHDARGEHVRLPIHVLGEGAVGGIYMARRYGAPVPVAITTAVLRNEHNEPSGAVAVIRDMSREHELDKLKGEFLQNISHELRTPLTPIKGYAEILSGTGLSQEKSAQFARGILESTQKLERIVALLVDYSSIEAGLLAPRTSSIDVGSMVESVSEEWSKRAPGHEIQAAIGPGLPRVSGDERLLRRTLEEVLDNAIKFSPNGGAVRLEVMRGANGSDGSTVVEVSVSDEGIGIQPEDLPTIFSDFHQLDSSETRTYGGLGLGLAFVQRIIQAHQGDVRVESQPDRGTRLTIAIPAAGATDGGV
jgi:PAS domain S-box-containing protein